MFYRSLVSLVRLTRAIFPSLAGVGLLALPWSAGSAVAGTMDGASTGTVETGAPAFVVMSPEALGLSTPPKDLRLLPDGRVLVVAPHEIAFGDGLRWETFRAADDEVSISSDVAVAPDGKLYAAFRGGIAQIDASEGSRWRFSPVVSFPAAAAARNPTRLAQFDQWLWYGDGNLLVSWRPGEPARIAGRIGALEGVYRLGQDYILADQTAGAMFRLDPNPAAEPPRLASTSLMESVTCGAGFDAGHLLVGTLARGPRLFDGRNFAPFGQPDDLLHSGRRITDLCAIGENYFAAAVDTVGIAFFDRTGHIVQVLERSLDHRLARVERLRYAPNGVLWVLLNEGLARIEFPSPVSDFSPLLASGLVYTQPLRHERGLWIQTDGRAMRGVYDATGRLDSFVEDTPQHAYLFTLTEQDGRLFATDGHGIYCRTDHGWELIIPDVVNARLGVARAPAGRIYYVARGEYGYLERSGDRDVLRRFPKEGLKDSYNVVIDDAGVGWIELGMSRVGRLDPRGAEPVLEFLGVEHGIATGWVETYVFEGIARFHISHQLLRFDEAQRRFVPDRELLSRFPQLGAGGGRPVFDSLSRLWYTNDLTPEVLDLSPTGRGRRIELPPTHLTPIGYTLESDGVAWLFQKGHLLRVDLRIPRPPAEPVRALIASVELPTTGRRILAHGGALAPLAYADNSLTFHFAAPANPFTSATTFEVLLEGSGSSWVSTGTIGAATFNRLKEGDYAFRVRPVVAGAAPGTEARLSFRILPPWYRTKLAWTLYVLTAGALVAFAAWLSSFLQRRENDRLERLVAARTRELNVTNRELERQVVETAEKSSALSASEERYRTLNAELEQRVDDRTAELSRSNQELAHREALFRLVFENAPVGISWKRSDLDVFHFNPTFLRIVGVPSDVPFSREALFKLVHPDDHPRQLEFSHLIERGEIDSYQVEQRFILADGRLVWGSLSVAVIRDDDGHIVQHIGILEDITQRKHAEEQLAETYKNLVATSRVAGMAEVATGVLHNVGNVLNSVNVSANILADAVQQSKTDLLVRLSALVHDHVADLGTFLTEHPKGRLVPEVLKMIAENAVAHRAWLSTEIASMQKNIDHIKEIVAMQQSYATTAGVVETLEAATLFEDALQMNESALERQNIQVVREFAAVPRLAVEKGKVLQILTNLIRNAKFACADAPAPDGKKITLRIEAGGADRIRLLVADNGVGIAAENLTKIFSHGFTTRAHGHGFGLHSSVLAARDMGGSLQARSDGLGTGATFTLELPIAPRDHTEAPAGRAAFPQAIEGRATITRRAPVAPAAV